MSPSLAALARDVLVEGIWRGVRRRAQSELIADLRSVRPSTYPLISGDGFRLTATIFLENEGWEKAEKVAERPIAFLDLTALEKLVAVHDAKSVGLNLTRHLGQLDSRPVVLLHNGDLLPPESILRDLEMVSSHLFSANLLHETTHRTALPLGIENLYLNRNGRIQDFLAGAINHEATKNRSARVFASFAVQNNERIRGKLVEDLDDSRFVWHSQRLTPLEHRQKVSNSKFVLSPPGRGADCHRTWEAIYLGAVPVVLKSYLAPSLIDSLPILAVDSYPKFFELTDSELDALYLEVRGAPVERAFMPYWITKLFSAASTKSSAS